MPQHDQARPEDMDTEGEDHVADADRYAFLSRPWMPSPEPLPPVLPPGARSYHDRAIPPAMIFAHEMEARIEHAGATLLALTNDCRILVALARCWTGYS